MTANEFSAKICELMNCGNRPPREEDRPVSVAVLRATYGEPSAALIGFEGSPPHCRVAVLRLDRHPSMRAIMFNESLLRMGKRHDQVAALLGEFLKPYLTRADNHEQGGAQAMSAKPTNKTSHQTVDTSNQGPGDHREPERLLTAEELGEFISMPANTVYKLALNRRLPSIKWGKFRRFRLSEVLAAIETGAVAVERITTR